MLPDWFWHWKFLLIPIGILAPAFLCLVWAGFLRLKNNQLRQRGLRKHQSGQGLVEYVIILALAAVVMIAALVLLGPEVAKYVQGW